MSGVVSVMVSQTIARDAALKAPRLLLHIPLCGVRALQTDGDGELVALRVGDVGVPIGVSLSLEAVFVPEGQCREQLRRLVCRQRDPGRFQRSPWRAMCRTVIDTRHAESIAKSRRTKALWGQMRSSPEESMSEYAVARLEDIDEISDGREPWRPVRHHFGITSFGINAWTGREAGDRIINEHDEEGEDEELYFAPSGRARFEFDGERVDAPAGTFAFAPPGVKRTAFAEEAGTTILAVGARPGQVYKPTGWELWAPAGLLYQEGRYEEAADKARDLVAEHPQYPALLYNLACCESLAGRKADAIEHLRLAIEISDSTRSYLAEDSDLDPLREEPEFQALLAG